MPEVAVRFAVSDGVSRTASTWKCWAMRGTGKDDVYLACRELGRALKASLHESGSWQVAFDRKFLDAHARRDEWPTRVVEDWNRPGEIHAGLTLAFRIVTPLAAVSRPLKPEDVGALIWVPLPPSEDLAVEVDVVFTKPGVPTTHWPGRYEMNTQLVGQFVLDGGDTVWLVSRVIPTPTLKARAGHKRFFHGHSEEDLNTEGLRAIVFGEEKDGSRVMYDYPVRYRPPESEV